MKKDNDLKEKIENQRKKLKKVIKKNGMDDRKVQKESEKLDGLLDKYYKNKDET